MSNVDEIFEIFKIPLNYAGREDILAKEITEQFGLSQKKLSGLIGGASKSPKVYRRLLKAYARGT